jgi:hypothetical protein
LADNETFHSELYDENNYYDIEKEPEIDQNVDTSLFLQSVI